MQNGKLRVGFEAGCMPFEMTDKNGRFVGFDIDMTKEMGDNIDEIDILHPKTHIIGTAGAGYGSRPQRT